VGELSEPWCRRRCYYEIGLSELVDTGATLPVYSRDRYVRSHQCSSKRYSLREKFASLIVCHDDVSTEAAYSRTLK
jgi:hypothetical protein